MTQLFQAIEYLHRNRICHRDLKPDNILVAQKQPIKIKVIDFNVAVELDDDETLI